MGFNFIAFYAVSLFCFSLNAQTYSTKIVIDKLEKQWIYRNASFEMDDNKFLFHLTDINEDNKFDYSDGIGIKSLSPFQQYGTASITDSFTITLFDRSFILSNLRTDGSLVEFDEIPFREESSISLREKFPNETIEGINPLTKDYLAHLLKDKSYDFILINAWSPSCGPCRESVKLLPYLKKHKIEIVNLCSYDDIESAKIFLMEYKMEGFQGILTKKLRQQLNVIAFPTEILYNKDLRIVRYFNGIPDVLNYFERKKIKKGRKKG